MPAKFLGRMMMLSLLPRLLTYLCTYLNYPSVGSDLPWHMKLHALSQRQFASYLKA